MQSPRPQPRTIADLTRAEHLLVWACRAILTGQQDNPMMARTFAQACGADGAMALTSYTALVRWIDLKARRRLRLHHPGCFGLGEDELAVLGVVAAAQDALTTGDEELMRMRLEFLVAGRHKEFFLFAAQVTARILAANGHTLPLRSDAAAPFLAVDPPGLRVVH